MVPFLLECLAALVKVLHLLLKILYVPGRILVFCGIDAVGQPVEIHLQKSKTGI